MKLFWDATHATLPRMRTRTNVIAVSVTTLALISVIACGSSPPPNKPEPTPPTPSATTASTGTTPATTGDAGGGGAADAATAAAPSKEEQCETLRNDAPSEMDAEIIKVDKPCKKNDDCMAVKGRACGFVCVTAAIPKAEEKDWTKEIGTVNDGPCKKWKEMECAKADAKKPTCEKDKMKATCEKGHCILK